MKMIHIAAFGNIMTPQIQNIRLDVHLLININLIILKHILKKKNNQGYTNLTITCTADQKLYCSNVVLDEDKIEDCRELAIPFEDDMFCCRWNFTDSSNNNKNNNYCASINEYKYLTIKDYIRYKSNHPLQRYDQLTIDCYSTTIKKPLLLLLFLFFLIK
jgi:hypothetical protein